MTEERNASSHFSGKSLLPPQIILSSYGHAPWRLHGDSTETALIIRGGVAVKVAKVCERHYVLNFIVVFSLIFSQQPKCAHILDNTIARLLRAAMKFNFLDAISNKVVLS